MGLKKSLMCHVIYIYIFRFLVLIFYLYCFLDIREPYKIAKNYLNSECPFGLVDIGNYFVENDSLENKIIYPLKHQLMRYFAILPPKESEQFFYRYQQQRKRWWRKVIVFFCNNQFFKMIFIFKALFLLSVCNFFN